MKDIEYFSKGIKFSGFINKQGKTRQAVIGEYIWNLLFKRDINFGGYFVEINGIMGSGKTTLLLSGADIIMDRYPEETIYWREPLKNPVQFTKLHGNYQVLSERRYQLNVFEVTKDKLLPTDDIPIRYFEGIKHLMKKSKKGMVNIVYFKDLYKWVDLINVQKYNGGWQTFLFDEFEDVCPQRATNKEGDKTWSKNELLASSMKEIRKSRVSCLYSTQMGSQDIDSRLRSKIMIYLYLFGSKNDKHSPIFRGTVQSIKLGECWLDLAHSLFGKVNFKPYLPKKKTYVIIPKDNHIFP